MRYLPRGILHVIVAAIFSLAAAYAVQVLPITHTQHEVIPLRHAGHTALLLPGDTISQSFRAPSSTLSGIVVFSNAPLLGNRNIEVTVTDSSGQEIGRSARPAASYTPGDGTLQLEFTTPNTATQKHANYTAHITLRAGAPLPLLVSDDSVYGTGTAAINEQLLPGDLAATITAPGIASFGFRQGTLVAAVFIVGFSLIRLTPDRWQWRAAAGLLVVITPLVLLGFWFSSGNLGISDWDYYFSYHESIRRIVLEYRTLPLWNPWTCGGTAALADPEFPLFTPTFLLELIFGIPAGFRLAVYLSVATTALGMLALAKRAGASLSGAVVASLAGTFGSVTLLEIVEGHPNVFAAMWVPWVLWAWLAAYRERSKTQDTKNTQVGAAGGMRIGNVCASCVRSLVAFNGKWPLVTGVFLALMFFQGGIYLLMYMTLAFLVLPILAARPLHAITVTVKAGVWALGLAAIKLVPVLFWLRQFPDESYASSTVTIPWLYDIVLGRHLHGVYILFQQNSGWHEYGAYIGVFVAALALIGLTIRNRLTYSLLAAAIMTLLLSSAGPALRKWFDLMPFFPRSNISRIILFTVIPLSLLAGLGLDRLRSRLKLKPVVVSCLIALVAWDLFSLAYQLSEQAFVLPPVYPIVSPAPSPIAYTTQRYDTQGQETRTTRAYAATRAGYGTFAYCSVLGPPPMVRTIHDEEDNGPFSAYPASTQAQLVDWAPSRVVITAQTTDPSTVIINTNFAEGWSVNGTAAYGNNGRVAIDVAEPGSQQLTFRYRPPGFMAGIAITVSTIIIAAWTTDRHRKKQQPSVI